MLSLETKQDELDTLTVQLEVASEKVETERIQAEERYRQSILNLWKMLNRLLLSWM